MVETEIEVSVICLTYNHEKYIEEAIKGFINQKTNFKYEIIIHDDASTDDTAKIIKKYETMYPEIIKPIYETENMHSKHKRITKDIVIPKAKGKYIALCEGDDFWCSDTKLQQQYDYMESHPECSLVTHKAIWLNEQTGAQREYSNKCSSESKTLNASDIILDLSLFPTASMFYRRMFYETNKVILDELKNFDYVIKILLATEGTVYFIAEPMSVYRYSAEGSWTQRVYQNDKKLELHYKISIESLKRLDEYRNFEFHNELEKEIKRREFDILVRKNDIATIKKEYKTQYQNLSLLTRIKMHMQKIPFMDLLIFKIKSIIRK